MNKPVRNIFDKQAVAVEAASFMSAVSPTRRRVDVDNLAYVAFDLPEYSRNGLGKAIGRVTRYMPQGRVSEKEKVVGAVCIAAIVCADSTRDHILYQDMNPKVLGASQPAVIAYLPATVQRYLSANGWSFDMQALAGAYYCANGITLERDEDIEGFVATVLQYPLQAHYLESNPLRTLLDNDMGSVVDWKKVL